MQRLRKTAKRHEPALLAAALTAGLFLVFLIHNGITPFDDKTFLFEDMKRQYLSFFTHYRDMLLGNENLYYSFRKGLGGGITGFFAYYLTDPLLVPLALVPVRYLPVAISFLLLLKVTGIAFTCGLFLETILPPENGSRRECLALVLCSTSFAFSTYVMANSTNVIWLNAMMLAPLLFLAARHLLRGGSILPHVLLTALILYANYYIAYMVFLFEILLVLVFFLKIRLRDGLRYAASLVLGAALDAFLLLPTWFFLSSSPKNSISLGFHPYRTPPSAMEIFSRLYSHSYDQTQIMEGAPHLYLGVMLLVPVLLFFLTGAVRLGTKLRMLILLGLMFASFLIVPLNLIWHAGTEPNGYLYRNAFLVVLLLTVCALRGLYALLRGEIPTGRLLIALILLLFGTILIFSRQYTYLTRSDKFINLFLIAAGAVICFLLLPARLANRTFARILLALFTGLQLWDLLSNANLIYRETGMIQTPASVFAAKYDDLRQAMDDLPPGDPIYRTENLSPYEQNDPMLLGYNGVTYYGSESSLAQRQFLKQIGYNNNDLYAEYTPDNTGAADALLGIRYLLESRSATPIRDTLPMAFACTPSPVPEDPADPFTATQNMISAIAGEQVSLFLPAEASCETDHPTRDGDIPFRFTITPAADGELFFYLKDCPGDSNLMLDLHPDEDAQDPAADAQLLPYGNMASLRVISLGEQHAGVPTEMTIHAYDGKLAGTPLFVTEDTAALAAVTHRANQRAGAIVRVNSADLIVALPAGTRSALLLIPYDDAWHVSANGHSLEISPWADFYTQITIPESAAGEPRASKTGSGTAAVSAGEAPFCLRMQYIPKGMIFGIFISLLALIAVSLIARRR